MSQQEANQIVQAAQRLRRSRGALKLALPTAAALGAGAAIAVGSIPGSDGTITGCYASPTGAVLTPPNAPSGVTEPPGALRLVDPTYTISNPAGAPPNTLAKECDPKQETQITWNQQGPAGPQGPAGGQGTVGAPGAPGTPLIGDTSFGISGNGKTFLKIEGIKGESTDKWHKDQISVDSFSMGAHSSGGGGGAGKTTIQSFTITKSIDKASPLLFLGAANGKNYKEMVLSFERKAGGTQHDYLKFTFGNVLISSVTDGTSQKQMPEEQVTFNFQKCKETFIPISPDGKAGSPVSILISGNAKI